VEVSVFRERVRVLSALEAHINELVMDEAVDYEQMRSLSSLQLHVVAAKMYGEMVISVLESSPNVIAEDVRRTPLGPIIEQYLSAEALRGMHEQLLRITSKTEPE